MSGCQLAVDGTMFDNDPVFVKGEMVSSVSIASGRRRRYVLSFVRPWPKPTQLCLTRPFVVAINPVQFSVAIRPFDHDHHYVDCLGSPADPLIHCSVKDCVLTDRAVASRA